MYEHRRANPFRKVVRVTAGWAPVSWFYARTLHHIDRVVFRLGRGVPADSAQARSRPRSR